MFALLSALVVAGVALADGGAGPLPHWRAI